MYRAKIDRVLDNSKIAIVERKEMQLEIERILTWEHCLERDQRAERRYERVYWSTVSLGHFLMPCNHPSTCHLPVLDAMA